VSGLLVLGIDPGTATTGYGLVLSEGAALKALVYGAITTDPAIPLSARLQQLYRELSELVSSHRPDQAAVEQLYFARNARTALSVGHARGVILLALADSGLPVHSYAPLEIKKAITGYGRANKEQMGEMVRLLLGLQAVPEPDDAADALAVAICHAHVNTTTSRFADAEANQGG
jgi:crossover junction endodeoxyribonuclease RuvC